MSAKRESESAKSVPIKKIKWNRIIESDESDSDLVTYYYYLCEVIEK